MTWHSFPQYGSFFALVAGTLVGCPMLLADGSRDGDDGVYEVDFFSIDEADKIAMHEVEQEIQVREERSMKICTYGNCEKEVLKGEGVIITGAGYQTKFCCWDHAAKWVLAIASQRETTQARRTAAALALAELVEVGRG